MKALIYFLLFCSLCSCWAVEEREGIVISNAEQRTSSRRVQQRQNYCHSQRNPSGQVVQDQFHFQNGASHLVTTIYQRISPQPCQPIILSFSVGNSSISREGNWRDENIVEIIEHIWRDFVYHQHQPTLQFRFKLNSNLSAEMTKHLKSLFLEMKRSESCYFFLILVSSPFTSDEQYWKMIPTQIKILFQEAIGNRAWISSSYFLLLNLNSVSMLNLGKWTTFQNKLEMVCVQSRNTKRFRLLLQTFCSTCLYRNNKPILIEAMDVLTHQKLSYNSDYFPNFMDKGFPLNIVYRVMRSRTPESVMHIQNLMDSVAPRKLLYLELKKYLGFRRRSTVSAWLNGVNRPGQRDFVEEIRDRGALTLGLDFTPLDSVGSNMIGFTFPYSEQRLAILAKRQTPFSKWHIIFQEVKGSIYLVGFPIVVVTAFIIAGFRRSPPPSERTSRAAGSFLLIFWDWIVYLNGIFYSQGIFPEFRKIAKSLNLVIFFVNMAGTLYMSTIRVQIATDLTTEEKAQEIQSIFQLNPNFVKDGLLWHGGRFEANDELRRVLPFQNARAAEADKTSINLQYFYEPATCVGHILSKERYVCVAFEEYMDLVIPTLPVNIRQSLFTKKTDDLGITDWVTIAYNRDFPWANELNQWTMALVESGIFQFWMRNMSQAISYDGEGDGVLLFESENGDVDSYEAQQEGLQRLAENFRSSIVAVVMGFLLEIMVFYLSNCNWSATRWGKVYYSLISSWDRFSSGVKQRHENTRRRENGRTTQLDFVP